VGGEGALGISAQSIISLLPGRRSDATPDHKAEVVEGLELLLQQ
jgi:hypothetical protein